MRPFGMQRAFLPMVLIDQAGGKMTQQELTQELNIDKVSANRIVSYLESQGWLIKKHCPEDRRKARLYLSAEGEQLVPEIKRAIDRAHELFLETLAPEEREELFRLFGKIRKNIQNQEETSHEQ